MNVSAQLEEVRTWPVEQRLEFVFQVWDDILDSGWQPTLPEELKTELDRRWAKHEANPADVRTWEQIEARLGQKP